MLTLTTLVLLSQFAAAELPLSPALTARPEQRSAAARSARPATNEVDLPSAVPASPAPEPRSTTARSARLVEHEVPLPLPPPPMALASPAPEVRAPSRAARLADREPRLSTGAVVGRMFTGALGGSLGLAGGLGVVAAGVYLGGAAFSGLGYTLGLIAGLALSVPLAAGLVIVGLAAGASFFGEHFGHAFAGAVPVAGIMVVSAALAATVLGFLLGPAVAVVLAASAAFVLTPVLIEDRKPELRLASPGRELQAAGGLSVAF